MPFDAISSADAAQPKGKAKKPFLVADLFCGAGGMSEGAVEAARDLGIDMQLIAANHWTIAIETHGRYHPTARHHLEDLEAAKPLKLVPEGYLDFLMAAPTCTYHSRARGGKPTSDQQRMDPWVIVRFCTELRVKRLMVENVWEFTDWGPIDIRTGRPIKSRKGEYFRAWIAALENIGFKLDWKLVVCADHGDATTRARFILVGRSDGKKLSRPFPSHSKPGDQPLMALKPWRVAREIIDWSNRGRSIFGRKIPLSPKTLDRIYAGAIKFDWPLGYLMRIEAELERALHYHLNRARAVMALRRVDKVKLKRAEKTIAYATARLQRLADERQITTAAWAATTPDPMVVVLRQNADGRSLDLPVPAVAAQGGHIGIAEAFMLPQANDGEPTRTVSDTPPTFTTVARLGLVEPTIEPFIATVAHGVEDGNDARRCKSVDEPLGAQHASGGKFGLVQPGPAPFVLAQGSNGAPRSTEEPVPAVLGAGKTALVEPFVLSQASGGAPRSTEEPIPAATTGGNGGAHALIAPYYGGGSGLSCTSDAEPLPTATTLARFGLVIPVTHSDGGNRARTTEQPLVSLTTAKGGELAIVMPVTHDCDGDRVRSEKEPLPAITGANRGELAFITAAFGERDGQAPRIHSLDNPTPTIPAQGRINLVEARASELSRYDVLFRMFMPPELAAATSFRDYRFAGNKTEQTKQIGNAVPIETAKAHAYELMRI